MEIYVRVHVPWYTAVALLHKVEFVSRMPMYLSVAEYSHMTIDVLFSHKANVCEGMQKQKGTMREAARTSLCAKKVFRERLPVTKTSNK